MPDTTSPLTVQQLDEIATRATAATRGPWQGRAELASHIVCTATEDGSYSVLWNAEWATEADAAFTAHAREDVDALLAEVRRLNTVLDQIWRLHMDSPMGPCPVCIDADAAAAGGDGLVPYPCPTARLAGATDCAPPHVRAAAEHPATEEPAPVEDTLPAWMYQRFNEALDAPAWDLLTDADRTYWEHHARAVRRAVARGGFKAAAVETDGTPA